MRRPRTETSEQVRARVAKAVATRRKKRGVPGSITAKGESAYQIYLRIAPGVADDIIGALAFHSWTCPIARRALENNDMDPRRIRVFMDLAECCREAWGS